MQYLYTNTHNFYKRVSKEVFRFKSFSLNQQPEVFKLTTDAVVLGCLCTPSSGKALDVGCGTGILSLMLAQRMPDLTQINAIDTNKHAVDLANHNFKDSIWCDKLNARYIDILDLQSDSASYDLIVSNPPFYESGLLPINNTKRTGKHIDNLTFEKLILQVVQLLSGDGLLSIILPFESSPKFQKIAVSHGLHVHRRIDIKPRPHLLFNRSVLELGFEHRELESKTLSLRDEQGQHYSEALNKLTGPFYLDS